MEEHITNSRLSLKEQAPLLMATLVGRKSYAYWISKTTTPGDWSDYFSANRAINFANIPYWVSASVQGALLAATRNDNTDKTQNVSIDPAHALAAGLAVSAGRVMLGFVQRIPSIYINQVNNLIATCHEILLNPGENINSGRVGGCNDNFYLCEAGCVAAAAQAAALALPATIFGSLIAGALTHWVCTLNCFCSFCDGHPAYKQKCSGKGKTSLTSMRQLNFNSKIKSN